MDSQDLAIVVPATVAVVISGLSWIYQAWLTKTTLKNQQALAREERLQSRLATAYEDFIEVAGQIITVAMTIDSMTMWQPAPTELPDADRVRRVFARMTAHGSPEVKKLLMAWSDRRTSFDMQIDELRNMPGYHPRGLEWARESTPEQQRLMEAWRELDAIRGAWMVCDLELRDRISNELRE